MLAAENGQNNATMVGVLTANDPSTQEEVQALRHGHDDEHTRID